MNAIVFLPNANRPGRNDYTGAFRPEAHRFAKLYGSSVQVVEVPITLASEQRRIVLDAMVDYVLGNGPLDLVVFMCHGTKRWLQLGFPSLGAVPDLARSIAAASKPSVRVVLYACHTAEGDEPEEEGVGGDGGFADCLRDELVKAGAALCWVDAHEKAGHTTRNPYVRRFEASAPVGGSWLVKPGSVEWSKWNDRLHNEADPLRFQFPLLTREQIVTALTKA